MKLIASIAERCRNDGGWLGRAWAFCEAKREPLAYLFFGGVTTLVNIACFKLFRALGLSAALANGLAWALSVLTAYVTNRIWVFHSRTRGAALLREFGAFVACRLVSGLIDEAVVVLGVDVLGPSVRFLSAKHWETVVKVASNIIVVILNYAFSKLLIFRRGRGEAR